MSDAFKLQVNSMENLYLKKSRKQVHGSWEIIIWRSFRPLWLCFLCTWTYLLFVMCERTPPRTWALSLCLFTSSFIHKPCSQKEASQIILSSSDILEAVGFHKSSPPLRVERYPAWLLKWQMPRGPQASLFQFPCSPEGKPKRSGPQKEGSLPVWSEWLAKA